MTREEAIAWIQSATAKTGQSETRIEQLARETGLTPPDRPSRTVVEEAPMSVSVPAPLSPRPKLPAAAAAGAAAKLRADRTVAGSKQHTVDPDGSIRLKIGKYRGSTINEILNHFHEGRSYLAWLSKEPWVDPALREALVKAVSTGVA